MKKIPTATVAQQLYAADLLLRLRKVFHYLYPGGIKEYKRDTVLFFHHGPVRLCLYNAYPGGVQLVFNRSLLSDHFDSVHEYIAPVPPDWRLVAIILTDILDKIDSHQGGKLWPLTVKPGSRAGSGPILHS